MNVRSTLVTNYNNSATFRKIASTVYNTIGRNSKSIKGGNNKILQGQNLRKNFRISIQGKGNTILIHERARITDSRVQIYGDAHKLKIGKNCGIKNTVFWFEDNNCSIVIGDNTTIEGAHIAVTEPNSSIYIGKDCMFSAGIDIRNGDSHSIIDKQTGKRINYAKDIEIGNHVWIGNGAQILKGVKIGSESIIGIKSLVTKDIPQNSIAVGMPAAVVKSNVTWMRKRIYD